MNLHLLWEELILVFALSGRIALRLFPFVVAGVLIGEALKHARWTGLIERACRRHPISAICWAATLGILSPLCTYGTVPIVLQLARTGTPMFPLITFLSVSSLMNPQLFIITWRGIGPEMALARVLAVLAFGLILGATLWRLPSRWVVNPRALQMTQSTKKREHRQEETHPLKAFIGASWRSLQFVGFYMLLGILLGSIIEVFVPGEWILLLFNPTEWFALPLAAILSVPLYACGGGTIPLIRSLLLSGMGKGSALAFFLAGPATRFTPLLALATVLKGSFLVVYVATLILFSLLAGLVYQMV
ncbi:permease [Candidatus Bipolaricaulota bacterium]|nr:permease [Candidatus Bipolaricaulota bacterium]